MSTHLQSLWGLQASNYSALGALTFTTWDIIVTMEDEIHEIWMKPRRTLHFLYLFLRYFSWVSQVVAVRGFLGLAAGIPLSAHGCRAFTGFITFSSLSLMFAVQIVEFLRVRALYRDNVVLRWGLAVFYVAQVIIMVIMASLLLHQTTFSSDQCSMLESPLVSLKLIIPPLIFEAIVFVLTMIKFYESFQDGSGHTHVLFKFMTDGIWAFALPLITLTANAGLTTLPESRSSMSLIAAVWMLALPGFCGYRLILNLSHLLEPRRRTITTGTNIMFDTVVDGTVSDPDALSDFSLTELYGYGTSTWTTSDDHNAYA